MGTQLTRYTYPPCIKGIDDHIHFAKSAGGFKSVCTSYCLGSLGIPPAAYNYSAHRHQRDNVLRRNGYAVRSRVARIKKAQARKWETAFDRSYALGTVEELRETIKAERTKWKDDVVAAVYLVTVQCDVGGDGVELSRTQKLTEGRHLILMLADGSTHTDTAPVEGSDNREVLHVQAVFPNGVAHYIAKDGRQRTRRGLRVDSDGVARDRGGIVR